jgi:hypothetical protein
MLIWAYFPLEGNCLALENGVAAEFRVVGQVLNSSHFLART